MKLFVKILKISFGFALFIYAVCSMAIAPAFTPHYFSMNVLRVTELIMFYFAIHGISIIVWTMKNEAPNRDFRIEIPNENQQLRVNN